ncbi:KinB-signaling pathway activation protein [Priestia aryabhattai]|uniref:KinB-signaling pathway activation protein n=1 Tax=Priestia TaxID=2800373 RepID=UPI000BA14420|nr:KinB-signaling pathway activation protein [Priestia flexa]MDT2048642.1 KinB-signaling pathway activation protein [Priestia flexa]OZT10928.1 KinB-signaling pathway activation protein [Priestia aryabhattai]USY55311.1 KinB-signaling pathway activation protein [Bacillus sp. 1780r2a1]
MNSRNWVRLFLSTLIVGGLSTSIVGFAVRWNEYKELFAGGEVTEILSILTWLIGVGFIFSLISQMGFFAYLTIHRFGIGIFRSLSLWSSVQSVLIVFVLFDLVYFRYRFFAEEGESMLGYLLVSIFVLAYGLVVAYLKARSTKKEAFIPALFFIIVITTVEWFPALRTNEESWLYLMLFPLLICNTYQLLILPKLTTNKKVVKTTSG